ncbi:MAG: hypothetical protein R3Y65_00530 [Bacillota bacterium]
MKNLYMTKGVMELTASNPKFGKEVAKAVTRFHLLDWGDLCEEDKNANDRAVTARERIVARYNLEPRAIYIIAEADRSATTILFPEEY